MEIERDRERGSRIVFSNSPIALSAHPPPPSPEGSYTDDTSQEHHTPHHRSSPSKSRNHNPDPHEFDDEFDDDDPLPVIGHCKALYSFDGERENTQTHTIL